MKARPYIAVFNYLHEDDLRIVQRLISAVDEENATKVANDTAVAMGMRVLDVWETNLETFLRLKSTLEMTVYCQENVPEPTDQNAEELPPEQQVFAALGEAPGMESALPMLAAFGFTPVSSDGQEFDTDVY